MEYSSATAEDRKAADLAIATMVTAFLLKPLFFGAPVTCSLTFFKVKAASTADSLKVADELFSYMDLNGDDKISQDEFVSQFSVLMMNNVKKHRKKDDE